MTKKGGMIGIALLAAALMLPFCTAATISGTVYTFSLEPARGAIVEANSTPRQLIVATHGSYELALPRGHYTIIVSYTESYRTSTADENITVIDDGSYVLDFIVFPDLSDENELLAGLGDDINFDDFAEEDTPPTSAGTTGTAAITIAVLMILALAILGYVLITRRGTGKERKEEGRRRETEEGIREEAQRYEGTRERKGEEKAHGSQYEAPATNLLDDEKNPKQEVLDFIISQGGRVTQKDIRKGLGASEAKISLILTELESEGIIKKIKRGKGNVIVMQRREHPAAPAGNQ